MDQLADCGCGLGAAEAVQDATQAVAAILARHSAISAQGDRLRQVLAAKGRIPSAVSAAYDRAGLDYVAKSRSVLDQLARKGVTIEQVVYTDGKPEPDPLQPGQYKSLRVVAPLPVVDLSAPLAGGGWVPLPIEMGSVSQEVASAVQGAVVVLLAPSRVSIGAVGPSSSKTWQQVAVTLLPFDDAALQAVTAFADCFDRMVRGGKTGVKAADACGKSAGGLGALFGSVPPLAELWPYILVGAAAAVAGWALHAWLQRSGSLAGCDVAGPKTRRGGRPLLLGDLYLHSRS